MGGFPPPKIIYEKIVLGFRWAVCLDDVFLRLRGESRQGQSTGCRGGFDDHSCGGRNQPSRSFFSLFCFQPQSDDAGREREYRLVQA